MESILEFFKNIRERVLYSRSGYFFAIFIRTLVLLAVLLAIVYFVLRREWFWVFILLLVSISQILAFVRFINYSVREVQEFALSVRYRDFSRNYPEQGTSLQATQLNRHFNEVNRMFRQLSREREAQYQYLQKLLELVDTGIISYDSQGNVVWMNEALKKMIGIVYLKHLSAMEKRDPDLYNEIVDLKPGDRKIIQINKDKIPTKVQLSATAFRSEDEEFTLIAFQNINTALDETEAQAWQKILRVMTHEIMNSVGPITSLADTIKSRLPKSDGLPETIADQLKDVKLGLDTISKRGQGLLRFAEIYRNFNKISQPQLSRFQVLELFEAIYQLMEPSLERKNVEMDIVLKETRLLLEADRNLIEQVLINLVINAIDASKDCKDPLVTLSGYRSDGHIVLEVADNGVGIPKEMIERIFVPFFSTKERGSGIGLSLSRQIMLLHKGNIQVRSTEGKGSHFMLVFPAVEA